MHSNVPPLGAEWNVNVAVVDGVEADGLLSMSVSGGDVGLLIVQVIEAGDGSVPAASVACTEKVCEPNDKLE